ncbi:MAG: membrane protein insertion efficiency factor YidD [Alphaproteobacteria bacterium]|nr:MAG: membrane protein insertion efficiency factor YidD [Alphaproteobacteria bacterium]
MLQLLKILVQLYKISFSPFMRKRCRFNPTCSVYALEVLNKEKLAKGILKIIVRLLKCNPFYKL